MKNSRFASKNENSLVALFYGYKEACIDRCVITEENGHIIDIDHNCEHKTFSSPKKILEELGVSPFHYKVNNDGSVDIFQELYKKHNLDQLPVKINKLYGNLILNDCGLKSLTNFPNEVHGDLNISSNNLRDLKGFTKLVTGSITISYNKLSSLEGIPEIITGDLNLVSCGLENLNNLPKNINGNLDISQNHLKDLSLFDSKILGLVKASSNRLTKLNRDWKYTMLRSRETQDLDLDSLIWVVEGGWLDYTLISIIENTKSRDEALFQLKAKAKLLKLI